MERKLNVQANVKTKNGKNLKVKTLVSSRYTHMGIDEQLVKCYEVHQTLANSLSFSLISLILYFIFSFLFF